MCALSRHHSSPEVSRAACNTPVSVRKKSRHFNIDNLNAGEALNRAHSLAFAPYAFRASVILRDRGILAMLEKADEGMPLQDIASAAGLSENSTHVLLEAGLGI